jgi:hypothetical protein
LAALEKIFPLLVVGSFPSVNPKANKSTEKGSSADFKQKVTKETKIGPESKNPSLPSLPSVKSFFAWAWWV